MPANMHHMVYRAIEQGEGRVDAACYVALHREIDLDGLMDLIEVKDVYASWADAAALNMEAASRDR